MFDDMIRRIAEQERQGMSLIRAGIVVEADYAAGRVVVESGGLRTPMRPWLEDRAHGSKTWSPPEIGEQVLLLCPHGDTAQAYVIGAVYGGANQPAENRGDVWAVRHADGAQDRYDRAAQHRLIDIPAGGSITIRCGASSITLSDAGIVLQAPRIDENPGS